MLDLYLGILAADIVFYFILALVFELYKSRKRTPAPTPDFSGTIDSDVWNEVQRLKVRTLIFAPNFVEPNKYL